MTKNGYDSGVSLRRYAALIRSIFSLLSPIDRYKLLALAIINLFLSTLDLIGVAALGVLTSIAVQGAQSQTPGNRTTKILEIIGLESQNFTRQITILAISAVCIFVVKIIFSAYLTRRTVRFLSYRAVEAGLSAMEKLLSNTANSNQKMNSQEMAYTVNTATNYGVIGVLGGLAKLSADLALMFLMIATLLFVDFKTASTTVIVFGLVSLFLTRRMRNKARKLGKEYFEHTVTLNQITLGTFTSAREIWVRSSERYFLDQVRNERTNLARIDSEQIFLGMINKYVFEITLIVLSFFVCLLQLTAESPARAAGTITIFLASIFRIGPAALSSQQTLIQLQTYFAKIETSIDFIQKLPTSQGKNPVLSPGRPPHPFTGSLELEHVDFKYVEDSDFAIREVNLSIKPGDFVAIVGPSGSGKSTLMDIMLGLLSPKSGRCLISGMDSTIAVSEFPGRIGFVPQEASIIPGTIRENILLGLDSEIFSERKFIETLEQVRMMEVLEKLPHGLNELIGERGFGLSGGQKQRLSLARALITDPDILFLDEATNSLDAETESAISDSLNSLKHNKTIVVIAHRLSTIVSADKIVFLDKGRIESTGKFEELKRMSPKFALFASLQGL